MANLLATGAGATEGLDNALHRMLLEQELQQRQDALKETTRHNQAGEADARRGQDFLQQGRVDANNEKLADNTRQGAQTEPIGADVSPDDYAKRMAAGIPAGQYSKIPGLKVQSFVGGSALPDAQSTLSGMKSATPDPTAFAGKSTDATSPLNAPDTIKNRGTQAQIQAVNNEDDKLGKPGTDVSNEVKTVKYKGQVVDANYNPKTRRYTDNKGADITSDVEHYEKPQQPLFAPIQTGSGYDTFDRRKGTVAPLNGPDGNPLPLATTAATRTMGEGAKMLEPHIDSLKNQAEQLDKAGLFGPIMSRVRQLAAKAGTIDEFNSLLDSDPQMSTDRRVGKFATSLGLMASGAGRVHGGARGGSSPQTYANFQKLISDSGSLQMFEGRLDAVDEYMAGYANGPGGAKGGPATGAADLIFDPATGTFKKP